MNKQAYVEQARHTEGFWMSFHVLVGDYPWLVKRMAAVLALFVPRTGMGSGAAAIVPIVMIAVMAAVVIPAYKQYQVRAQEAAEMQALMGAVTPAGPASTPSDH
jgi:hypothetical protein